MEQGGHTKDIYFFFPKPRVRAMPMEYSATFFECPAVMVSLASMEAARTSIMLFELLIWCSSKSRAFSIKMAMKEERDFRKLQVDPVN